MFNLKILLGFGIFLLGFTVVWEFIIIDEFEKLDENYYHYEEQVGINSFIENGGLSESFPHHNSYEIKVVNVNDDNLKITSRLIALNTNTDEVFLDETRFFDVNAKTKAHQSIEKGFFMFPSNVEKRDYFITFPLAFTQAIFSFVQETEVNGLSVYEFDCISEPYDISNAIPLFKDSIVKSIYSCKIWVEPITGQHVNFNLSWESYFEEDGKFTTLVEKGNKKTTSEYVTLLTENTKSDLIVYQILYYFIPGMFLLIGSIFVIYSYMKKTKELEKTLEEQLEKDEFAAMISHEIKTPLVPIQLHTEMLLKGILGSLDDKQIKSLHSIHTNTISLMGLVDDMLDITKLELGKLTLDKKQVDIQDLLIKNIESLNIFAEEKKVTLELDLKTSGKILCDPKRVNQIISNLVKNSIDFIPENTGLIKLAVEKNTESFVFTVIDNGPGIPVENQEHLFHKFYQVDTSLTRKHGGTGLGLAICQGLVESHGGKIWLDKEYTQGACFKFTIPRQIS